MSAHTTAETVPGVVVVVRDGDEVIWRRIGRSHGWRPPSWTPVRTLAEIVAAHGSVEVVALAEEVTR